MIWYLAFPTFEIYYLCRLEYQEISYLTLILRTWIQQWVVVIAYFEEIYCLVNITIKYHETVVTKTPMKKNFVAEFVVCYDIFCNFIHVCACSRWREMVHNPLQHLWFVWNIYHWILAVRILGHQCLESGCLHNLLSPYCWLHFWPLIIVQRRSCLCTLKWCGS